jgi:hypothetical protein
MDNTTSEIGLVPLKSGVTTVSIEDESAATNTSISPSFYCYYSVFKYILHMETTGIKQLKFM